ncbi:hypothetical protein ACPUVO_04015 [Pseudocolwellia sp. HL-MZ19]|uniref:hypothetical protein n=1 Tax=unclassified Pseudocolwellia TaxID=2848178 RepID=UPI003CED3827
MRKLNLGVIIIFTMGMVGCSSSTESANTSSAEKPLLKEFHPEQRSVGWCQENYSSASVSMKDRQSNAKYCDSQSRQAYLDAKRDQRSKEDER